MDRTYCAVTRMKQSDELKHFKYVHKEKKNGKWVYYYKDDFDDRDKSDAQIYRKTEGSPNSKYGTYKHGGRNGDQYTVKVKKGKGLLNKTTTTDIGANSNRSNRVAVQTREIGKLEQGVDSVKKKAKKIGKKTVKSLNKQIDRGQKWLNGLFD